MVQFSFRAPNADYLGFPATTEGILESACKAEELGFDAIRQGVDKACEQGLMKLRRGHFPRPGFQQPSHVLPSSNRRQANAIHT